VSGQTYKTQVAAVAFLVEQGFKVGKSKFNNDVAAGLVSTNAEGHFEEGPLLAYAALHLTAKAKTEDAQRQRAHVEKLSADQALKITMNERLQHKLAVERGEVIARADHERELATRCMFFRADLLTLSRELAPQLVVALGVDESRIKQVRLMLEEALLARMDFWASDREFVVPLDQENMTDA
jgi:hypothetical protein